MILKPRQFTLAATSLGSSLAFIDATALTVALPTIQSQLHLGLHGIQWVFLSYSITLAIPRPAADLWSAGKHAFLFAISTVLIHK